MEIRGTREEILRIIANRQRAGERTKLKDLEVITKKNRSGLVRHIKESINEGWLIDKKDNTGSDLQITFEGLEALGDYDFDVIRNKVGQINEICIAVLIELTDYPQSVSTEVFKESIKSKLGVEPEVINECLKCLLKNRFTVVDMGKIKVSHFALVVLINNELFSASLTKVVEKTVRNSIKHLKVQFSQLGIKPEDVVSKISQCNKDALIEVQDDIKHHLHDHNKRIDDILNDDSVFKELELMINKKMMEATLYNFFGVHASQLVKIIPGLLDDFKKG